MLKSLYWQIVSQVLRRTILITRYFILSTDKSWIWRELLDSRSMVSSGECLSSLSFSLSFSLSESLSSIKWSKSGTKCGNWKRSKVFMRTSLVWGISPTSRKPKHNCDSDPFDEIHPHRQVHKTSMWIKVKNSKSHTGHPSVYRALILYNPGPVSFGFFPQTDLNSPRFHTRDTLVGIDQLVKSQIERVFDSLNHGPATYIMGGF